MNVYHFTYSHPGYNIGDTPSVVDFFFASDDQLWATEQFKEYSCGIECDNLWVYEHTMDPKTAKDAAHFAYHNHNDPDEADSLMVAVLQKCPSIANTDLLIEASVYRNPNTLKMVLHLLSNKTLPIRALLQAVYYNNEENSRILVESGRIKDLNGQVLAYTCEMGRRNLFDTVLPISNVDVAMRIASTENFQWLEEAFAMQQQNRLHQTIDIPTTSRARKI